MNLEKVLKKYPKEQTFLIEILLDYQKTKTTHHVTESELKRIAEYLGVPESHVFSVVTFYSFFSMKPKGKFIIQYCRDVPCYVSDDINVKEQLEKLLSIKTGETTEDNMFTLQYSSCLGMCDVSPVIRVNDKIYKHVTVNKLKMIIAECRGEDNA